MHARQSGRIQLLGKQLASEKKPTFCFEIELTDVTKEFEGLRQCFKDLIVNLPSDIK